LRVGSHENSCDVTNVLNQNLDPPTRTAIRSNRKSALTPSPNPSLAADRRGVARRRGTSVAISSSVTTVAGHHRDRNSHSLLRASVHALEERTWNSSLASESSRTPKTHRTCSSTRWLVALIALVAVAAITTAGSNVNTIFTQIAAKLVVPSS
jgi:hypothetical protein